MPALVHPDEHTLYDTTTIHHQDMMNTTMSSPGLNTQADSLRSEVRPNSGTSVPIRSCHQCRQRKLKCDRQKPCSACVRTGADCVYPAGRGRAPKRPLRALNAQLVDHVSRLETLVRQLGHDGRSFSAVTTASSTQDKEVHQPEVDGVLHANGDAVCGAIGPEREDIDCGRLMIDETRSVYISNAMWTSLANQVDELHDMLHGPISESTDMNPNAEPSDENCGLFASASANSSSMLFNHHVFYHSMPYSLQPSTSQAMMLFTAFKENVAPLVRIFHMPTLSQVYWDAIASPPDNLDTDALLVAIHYAAIVSIGPDACQNILGASRDAALKDYRLAVERALSQANLLNTQSIVLLQAVVVFLTVLRNQDDSRTTLSLTALVYHLAQTMGIHRDGTTFGLKPFETEIRRRLWWHICILDTRSSEYHGCEPIVHESAFDTQPPLHINDSDICAGMLHPPVEREEATDMTLCLIRCEAMRIGWKLSPTGLPRMPIKGAATYLTEREDMIDELEQRLERKYVRFCDNSHPYLRVAFLVARLIVSRFRLMIHLPWHDGTDTIPVTSKGGKEAHGAAAWDTATRNDFFSNSIKVLQLSSELLTSKDIRKWKWYSKTHIQWQSVAFVLSEICSRGPSAECDIAWECVNTLVFDEWNMKESERRTTPLWQPIQRLLARARFTREIQGLSLEGRSSDHLQLTGVPDPESSLYSIMFPTHYIQSRAVSTDLANLNLSSKFNPSMESVGFSPNTWPGEVDMGLFGISLEPHNDCLQSQIRNGDVTSSWGNL